MIKINDIDITFVVQGDQRDSTNSLLVSIKKLFPSSFVVFSTTDTLINDQISCLADHVIISKDPGPLPSYTKYDLKRINNINRQIVTTKRGVYFSKTRYTVKIRSDLNLSNRDFVKIFELVADESRLLVPSIFTRHPNGINQYLFNVSDWFIFGLTENLLKLFDVDLIDGSESTWFDINPHKEKSSYSAKRFRAKFTPEQSLFIPYASLKKYQIPKFFNDVNEELVTSYNHFISKELIVADCKFLGVELDKYSKKISSLYQRLDCVSFSDWINISRVTNFPEKGNALRQKTKDFVRGFIKPFKRVIIYLVVKLS